MGEVVGINGAPPAQVGEPQPNVVRVLEDLLERAKSGQLQSFVGTGFCCDGCRLTTWAGHHENVHEMLGAIAWLEHEYVARITGTRE